MRHPPILIHGFSEAHMLLKDAEPGEIQAIISIHGCREHPIDIETIPHRLILRFDDVESPDTSDLLQAARARIRNREAAEIGLQQTPPSAKHARAIIDFAGRISNITGRLLCQCQAGISRSPAAALLCLAAWTGPGCEQSCIDHLLSIRRSVLPHRDLVALGDEIMGRSGRLLECLDRSIPY